MAGTLPSYALKSSFTKDLGDALLQIIFLFGVSRMLQRYTANTVTKCMLRYSTMSFSITELSPIKAVCWYSILQAENSHGNVLPPG